MVRGVYEACVFQALRERLRCKEIWVVGAHEWRNPDEDLPTDFEIHRAAHYDKLRKPLDPTVFTAGLRRSRAAGRLQPAQQLQRGEVGLHARSRAGRREVVLRARPER